MKYEWLNKILLPLLCRYSILAETLRNFLTVNRCITVCIIVPWYYKVRTKSQSTWLWKTLISFLSTKYFFVQHQLVTFVATRSLFCAIWKGFFWHKCFFRGAPNFCCGHYLKCCVRVTYVYCHVATKILSRIKIKINKISFLCGTKRKTSLFVHHKFSIFNFDIAHWQHVDLLLSGFRDKVTFRAYSPAWYTGAVTVRSCSGKKECLLFRFIFAKHLWRAHISVKLKAYFPQLFQNWTP